MPAELRNSIAERGLAHMRNLTPQFPSKLNRSDAIRRKCVDCCGGQPGEVAKCESIDCPLWLFRYGDDPFQRRASKRPGALSGEG